MPTRTSMSNGLQPGSKSGVAPSHKWTYITLGIIATCIVCNATANAIFPTFRFRNSVMRFADNPAANIGEKARANTYEDPVTTTSLSDCFDGCYFELEHRFGTPKTFVTESASYPVQSSVWQFRDCYLELSAVSANDNDSISISVQSGIFIPVQHAWNNTPWELAKYRSLRSFSIRPN